MAFLYALKIDCLSSPQVCIWMHILGCFLIFSKLRCLLTVSLLVQFMYIQLLYTFKCFPAPASSACWFQRMNNKPGVVLPRKTIEREIRTRPLISSHNGVLTRRLFLLIKVCCQSIEWVPYFYVKKFWSRSILIFLNGVIPFPLIALLFTLFVFFADEVWSYFFIRIVHAFSLE